MVAWLDLDGILDEWSHRAGPDRFGTIPGQEVGTPWQLPVEDGKALVSSSSTPRVYRVRAPCIRMI